MNLFHAFLTAVAFAAALAASLHAILNKRDARSAVYWVVLSWFSPFAGPVLYLLFGINRVERRARRLKAAHPPRRDKSASGASGKGHLSAIPGELTSLSRLLDTVTSLPLVPGNSIEPLVNGDQAYPAMIEAIDHAQDSVSMCTYIFERDEAGEMFAEALARAKARGVETRLLVDDVGALYGSRGIYGRMEREGIRVASFLPTRLPGRFWHWNMRNHRKLLIADGRTAFTGGMNVRHRHLVESGHPQAVADVHFRVRGPVVNMMQQVFADDWEFTTHEVLEGPRWFPAECEPQGDVWVRAIPAGPDEDIDRQLLTLHGAISCARRSLCIISPFFLPDPGLVTALGVAAMRGIQVDIVVPSHNHTRFVQWASIPTLRQLIETGCRVWLSPPPFDHSKLFIVDERWAHIGSGNWDPRSLRLNFEFNLECYSDDLAQRLTKIACSKISASEALSIAVIDKRTRAVKIRDSVARLFSPLL